MRASTVAVVLALMLLGGPATVRADEPMWGGPPGSMAPAPAPYQPLPPAPATREVSYGPQTLISDGIAVALVTAGFLQDNPYSGLAVAGLGLNVYAFGAPIVHFAHGQVGNGFKSFGARMALPLVGAMAGNLLGPKDAVMCELGPDGSSCPASDESALGMAIGFGLGGLAAMALDAHAFAHKRVHEPAPQLVPAVGYARSGFSLGVGGSF